MQSKLINFIVVLFQIVAGCMIVANATAGSVNLGRNDYTAAFTNGLAFHISQPLEAIESEQCKKTSKKYSDHRDILDYRMWSPDCFAIEGKMTVINSKFEEIFPPICLPTTNNVGWQPKSPGRYGLIACKTTEGWGIIDLRQKWLFPPKYYAINFLGEPFYDTPTYRKNGFATHQTGRPKNNIGSADLIIGENYFFRTVLLHDIILENGAISLVPYGKMLRPQFDNYFAYPVIMMQNFSGTSDPDEVWGQLFKKIFQRFGVYIAASIIGLVISILAGVALLSASRSTPLVVIGAIGAGIIGGLIFLVILGMLSAMLKDPMVVSMIFFAIIFYLFHLIVKHG